MPIRSIPAKPASLATNLVKAYSQTAALWAVCFVLLPYIIHVIENHTVLRATRFDPGNLRWFVFAAFWGCAFIGFRSGYVLVAYGDGTPMPLACTHRLVIRGPYRYIRNPMSAMGIAQGLAIGLFLGSPITIAYSIAGAIFWQTIMRPWEERDMAERFGESYREYQRKVRCWIPNLKAYTAD